MTLKEMGQPMNPLAGFLLTLMLRQRKSTLVFGRYGSQMPLCDHTSVVVLRLSPPIFPDQRSA